ncbi:hypothetical protein F3Y22_tig00111689pilonHSYRG00024 [Hibiscus syriacus]|uniref:Uncharacterized protein n=1 Tax=Hibiscus syriacus TaxID=106335 RepID=A0A6A2XGU1_HIBSY|nr:hypothetical protein F3Y22_tig00111689pilonHSYRG00024 [Hibiscus syriacus]
MRQTLNREDASGARRQVGEDRSQLHRMNLAKSLSFMLNGVRRKFNTQFQAASLLLLILLSSSSSRSTNSRNVSYIPGNLPMVAVSVSHPEVGMGTFAPRSSTPSKFISYGNISAATGVSGSQFSQPIVGHMGNRTQPLRFASHIILFRLRRHI